MKSLNPLFFIQKKNIIWDSESFLDLQTPAK